MSNSAFKKLRLSKGYSQTELARLLNVTVRALFRGGKIVNKRFHTWRFCLWQD